MQREKLASYLGIAMQAGYAIIGSDKLDGYDKKLYLVLVDSDAGKTSRKVFDRLIQAGVEGYEVESLGSLNGKTNKIIGIKNKGLSEEIKKYLN